MTSNRSLFNVHLLRETMRRNIWAVALSVVGFFFCLPLPVAITIQNFLSNDSTSVSVEYMQRRHTDTIHSVERLLSMDNYFVRIGLCIMAVLCGIALFSYLHSRQRVDFYHAQPIKRGALFANNFVAGLMTVLPGFVIMYVLAVIIAVTMGMGEAFSIGMALKAMAVHGIFFLLIFTVSILATILTGNTIIAVLLNIWLMFSVVAVSGIMYMLGDMYLQTWDGSGILDWMIQYLSPIVLYFSFNTGVTIWDHPAPPVSLVLICVLAVTIVLAALSYVLFCRRKSENAGTAISFERIKLALKCYMVLVMSLGFGVIMGTIAGEFWVWFGVLAGTVIGHAVVEIIYHFDLRAAFANIKTMVVLGVVGILIIAGVQTDILGFDKWLPKENQVQAVGIRVWTPTFSYKNMNSVEKPVLTSPESINGVWQLSKAGVDYMSGKTPDGRNAGYSDDFGSADEVWVTFALKSGRTVKRHYYLRLEDELWNSFNQVRFSEDYIRNASPLYQFDLEEAKDSLVLEVRTQADTSDKISAEMRAPAQTQEIIKTLREESLTLTADVASKTVPVLRMDVVYAIPSLNNSYTGRAEYIPIYPSYTRTLQLIQQYSGLVPRQLSVEDVKSILIYSEYREPYDKYLMDDFSTAEQQTTSVEEAKSVVIDDPAQIEALLKGAITEQVMSTTDQAFPVAENNKFNIEATFKNNQFARLYYQEGSFPEALCEAYLK